MKSKNIAFFDFDGTITTKDTLIDFIRFAVGDGKMFFGMFKLSLMLLKFKLKMIPNDKAKERMLAHFFKGWDAEKFHDLSQHYSLTQIDTVVRPKALKRIHWHKEKGDEIVIVSASMQCWLKAWCERESLGLLSTQLEMLEGKVSGRFLTQNCHGKEKEVRIREAFSLEDYEKIYAYGDSGGDREMLALADERFFKPFR